MKRSLLLLLVALLTAGTAWSQVTRWYVDADATGTGDGLSWTNAMTSLDVALDSASSFFAFGVVEVWVAEGIYQPVAQDSPFVVNRNIHVYGGFDGTETALDQRDPDAHPTILDGDLNGDDNGNLAINEPTRQDNAFCLVYIEGSFARIDGLIIQNANGSSTTGPYKNRRGSAVHLTWGWVNSEVINCEIRNNSAIEAIVFSEEGVTTGGGSYGAGLFRRNEIHNNLSGTHIIWLRARCTSALSNPPNFTTVFQNNLVHGNTLSPWTTSSRVSVVNLVSNFANAYTSSQWYSGRDYFQDVSQNTFADNTLPATNAAVIRHHYQTETPGGVFAGQFLFVTDNIFSGNGGAPAMFHDTLAFDKENTQAVFIRNIVQDGDSILNDDLGSFNPVSTQNGYGVDPGFTDRTNDDYTIVGCDKPGVDLGGSWIISGPTALDFYGNPRTVGFIADIGHAENQDTATIVLTVEQVGSELVATPGFDQYVWVFNEDPANAVVEQDSSINTLTPTNGDGEYYVVGVDADDCTTPQVTIDYCGSVNIDLEVDGDSIRITGTSYDWTSWVVDGVLLDDTVGIPPLPLFFSALAIADYGYGEYRVTVGNGVADAPSGCTDTESLIYCGGIPTVQITQSGDILTASVDDASTYIWTQDGDTLTAATGPSIDASAYGEGDFQVSLIASGPCTGTSNVISYCPGLSVSVTQNGFTLEATPGLANYQWFQDGTAISGATSANYTATANGDYYVEVTDAGCTASSNTVTVTGLSIDDLAFESLRVFPNPTTGVVNVATTGEPVERIVVTDLTGSVLLDVDGSNTRLDLSTLDGGLYLIDVRGATKRSIVKLVLQ